MTWINCLLLLLEAAVYFAVMATLFQMRQRFGIGLFICALGAMHFVETYLAAVFYVALPFGVISPGSTVMFSGKLMMLLLLYIKEDAATVRQPIYGLLAGNLLIIALAAILRLHEVAPFADGRRPDLSFINEMGVLMAWGTTLLFIDAIAIILFYEKLRHWLGPQPLARLIIASCGVLTFDQIGFFAALYWLYDAPVAVLFGGWFAKLAAALVFSVMIITYLRWFERPSFAAPGRLIDIFDVLTYRERYEALVEEAGRDSLTGLLHRGRFEQIGRDMFAARAHDGPLNLLVIDIDHFKSINDLYGHPTGDRVLREFAQLLSQCAGPGDRAFRIGGEEFAILTTTPDIVARLLAENICAQIRMFSASRDFPVSVSIGVASAHGLASLDDLLALADRHLYAAKQNGRDRVYAGAPSAARKPSDSASSAMG